MAQNPTLRRAMLFCLALFVAVPVCLALWGLVLPVYARGLGWVTVGVLDMGFGQAIEAVDIAPGGILNTRTQLAFTVGSHRPTLDVGALVFNIPPFVALMALTPGLAWCRRLKGLAIGLAVLCLGHVAYVVLAFLFAPRISQAPQVPMALGELFLSLPFLLWIVLGYWEKIRAYFAPPKPPAPTSGPPL